MSLEPLASMVPTQGQGSARCPIPMKRKTKQPKRPQVISPTIKVRGIYSLVFDRVETAVGYGLRRSIKYVDERKLSDDADFEAVREQVVQSVMSDLCELLDFGDAFGEP